jgi:D-3-phosphoglycerate dehydrogenase
VKVVILDSLFDDLDVERHVAASYAAEIERWDGTVEGLAAADVAMHVRTRVDAGLIDGLTRCRVIGRFGTGLDSVDLAAAGAAGIKVVGVRDYCLPELPTHTLALGFALVRRVGELASEQAASWDVVAAERPVHRRPCAVVVGLGSVGARVAAALVALDYSVIAVSEHGHETAASLAIELVPLDAALARADIVFLHCALDDRTRGLIDARRLALFPRGALLVNTARLGLLDEHAVAAALADGQLGGLGLDAQLAAESPLRRYLGDPRVLVTPHIGWYSVESASELRRKAMAAALDAAGRPRSKESDT